MKQVDEGAFLDELGELLIREQMPPDPFDPPGKESNYQLRRTGYYYLDVPTYSWPLAMFWQNNSLQFATKETAEQMARIITQTLNLADPPDVVEEVVKVGPFSWERKYQLAFPHGKQLNAGLEASTYARYPQNYADSLWERL